MRRPGIGGALALSRSGPALGTRAVDGANHWFAEHRSMGRHLLLLLLLLLHLGLVLA
jgi:hypothetical protein